MPELPEVETTSAGIKPHLIGATIDSIIVRQPKLRVPVTENISEISKSQQITNVYRRAKYLIIELTSGYFLIHLGMSGHLRIITEDTPHQKHDHIDLILKNGTKLRYNDPRRFGLWIYETNSPENHRLLSHLGPEPLESEFHKNYLHTKAQNKSKPIKSFIMDNNIVVGVGNIYATESLFLSKIHPQTPAKEVSFEKYLELTNHIKKVLEKAIAAGGTTLKDFYATDGKPGYFVNELQVYGQQGKPCPTCSSVIESLVIGGRNSAFCPECQL